VTTDQNGNKVAEVWYYPYGGVRKSSQNTLATSFRFVGQHLEENLGADLLCMEPRYKQELPPSISLWPGPRVYDVLAQEQAALDIPGSLVIYLSCHH